MVPVDIHKLMIHSQAMKVLIVDMEWAHLLNTTDDSTMA